MQLPGFREIQQNEFLKNLTKLLSSSIVAQLVPILVYPLLTRIFTPADFGTFALFMSLTAVLVVPATGRYEFAIMLPEKDEDAIQILGLSLRISIIFSLFFLMLALVFPGPIAKLTRNEAIKPWLWMVPVSVFFSAAGLLMSNWLNRKKEYGRLGWYTINQSITGTVGKLAFGIGRFLRSGLILGNLFGQLTGFLTLTLKFKGTYRNNLAQIANEGMKLQARRYSNFPKFRMFHAFVNTISGNLPVFLITAYFSPLAAGLFSLAFSVLYKPISLVTNGLSQVLAQQIIAQANQGKDVSQSIKKLLKQLFFLGIVPFAIVAACAPVIFRIVFGNEWFEAGKYLQVMTPWLFTVFLSAPLAFLSDLAGKQGKQLLIAICALLLRSVALLAGILSHSILLGLCLLSAAGVFINIIYIGWYLRLSTHPLSKGVHVHTESPSPS